MIRTSARRDLARSGRLADREPLAEVVQADPGRDQQREPAAGCQRLEPRAVLELLDGSGARADQRGRALRLQPAVVVDEAHHPGRDPEGEQRRVADEARPVVRLEVGLDGLDAVRHHVPEEEDQNAGRDRAQCGAQLV